MYMCKCIDVMSRDLRERRHGLTVDEDAVAPRHIQTVIIIEKRGSNNLGGASIWKRWNVLWRRVRYGWLYRTCEE